MMEKNINTSAIICNNEYKTYKHYGAIQAEKYLQNMESIETKRKRERLYGDNQYISVRERMIMKKQQELMKQFEESDAE